MRKIKTKILLGVGVTTTLLTTGSIVLSCGMSDQQKLDEITTKMVADYVKAQARFIPSYDVDIPTAAPSDTIPNATLNGVSGLTITISNWVAIRELGLVTFDASISKTGLTIKSITGVTYDGWGTTDQKALNAVTAQMVANYVKTQKGFAPSVTIDAPTNVPSTTLTNATLNGLDGLTIAISNWAANVTLGSVTFDVSISKPNFTSKNITGVTYSGWNNDQNKLIGITSQDVVNYIKTQTGFVPSTSVDIPAIVPRTTLDNVTFLNVSGLTLTISNWVPNHILGSVTFDVSISKPSIKNIEFVGVSYDGWNTDQDKLNAVTAQMVANYVKTQTGFVPQDTNDSPDKLPSATLNNAILNNLSGLTITISNWTTNFCWGSVTFDVIISRSGLKDTKNITGVTYDGYKLNRVINKENINKSEGKLWSWDDATHTLKIFVDVIGLDGNHESLVWGSHDTNTLQNINFPDTLSTIADSAFSTADWPMKSLTFPASLTSIGIDAFINVMHSSLTFKGAIPNTSRILTLGSGAFLNLPISAIAAGDSGTAIQWQDWARAHCPSAFKS